METRFINNITYCNLNGKWHVSLTDACRNHGKDADKISYGHFSEKVVTRGIRGSIGMRRHKLIPVKIMDSCFDFLGIPERKPVSKKKVEQLRITILENKVFGKTDVGLRSAINMLIRAFAKNNNAEYSDCFSALYRVFGYRHHIDLKQRARNRKMKPLDYAESEGLIEKLYKTCVDMYGNKEEVFV